MRTFYIGRNPENDIVINDPVVSGRHAEISVDDFNRVVYTDYSTNGTYINGRLIRHGSCEVSVNDQVVFPNGVQLNWNQLPGIFGLAANTGTQYAMPGQMPGPVQGAAPMPVGQNGGNVYSNIQVNMPSGPGDRNAPNNYNNASGGSPTSMGMGTAIKSCFSKYATFRGRARRSEFWFWALFQNLIALALIPCMFSSMPESLFVVPGIWGLWLLISFLPSLAVTVRRLHDTGKSGLLLLLYLIPFVQFILPIVFFIFYCMDSTPGENQYGPNPKYS